MRTPKLHVSLMPGFLTKLSEMAANAGVAPDEYAAALLTEHVRLGSVPAPVTTTKRAVGRPAYVDDLPVTVERDASPSGFVGVTAKGKLWQAKVDKVVLGRFSTPELAATVRHYALHGFRVGRGAFIASLGVDVATAMEEALRAGFAPLTATAEAAGRAVVPSLRRVGPDQAGDPHTPGSSAGDSDDDAGATLMSILGRNDPPAGLGTAEGSRATPADGGRAPSTSVKSVAQVDDAGQDDSRGQSTVYMTSSHGGCPVCGGVMDAGVTRVHSALCLRCNDDYETWSSLPAAGELDPISVPGVYTNTRGSRGSESFTDYVTRVRRRNYVNTPVNTPSRRNRTTS